MYLQKKTLRLSESDASGVLYFAAQFKIAEECFEEYLEHSGILLSVYLEGNYLLPIVHAEADFVRPVRVGDQLELFLSLLRIGHSSFTLHCTFREKGGGAKVGHTTIVHVVVERSTWTSSPIPEDLKAVLIALMPLA